MSQIFVFDLFRSSNCYHTLDIKYGSRYINGLMDCIYWSSDNLSCLDEEGDAESSIALLLHELGLYFLFFQGIENSVKFL